jgi:hypothetical protein
LDITILKTTYLSPSPAMKCIPSDEKLAAEQSNGGNTRRRSGALLKTLAKQEEIVFRLVRYQNGWHLLKGGETKIC